jgi:hypothetical protein
LCEFVDFEVGSVFKIGGIGFTGSEGILGMNGETVHGGTVDQGEIFRGSDVSGQDPVEAVPEVDSFLLNVRKGLEKIEKCI